jgi:integrase
MAREVVRLELPKLTPHGLRHVHANVLLDAGASVPAVSARLGHAKPSITLSVYGHRIGDDNRQAADAMARMMAR